MSSMPYEDYRCKACESIRKQFGKDFISLMPTKLYGPFDYFDLNTSHVLPAMIRKFHEAEASGNKPVELWGSGIPMREFLHVDGMADAVVFAMENEISDHFYNVGSGTDLTIKSFGELIQREVGHQGEIHLDSTKQHETSRKLMVFSKMTEEGWTY